MYSEDYKVIRPEEFILPAAASGKYEEVKSNNKLRCSFCEEKMKMPMAFECLHFFCENCAE